VSGDNSAERREPDAAPPPSDRARLRRKPQRGSYDRAVIDEILDASVIGHVAWVYEGMPYATPTCVWRHGDRLYWHASAGSRMVRSIDGQNASVTVTHMDSLVLARSATNHSVNYRSVIVQGTAHLVEDGEYAAQALEHFIEHLYPGRWAELRPMTDKERKATGVMWMAMDEASAKIRNAGAVDDEGDETWPTWAGTIPVSVTRGAPEPDAYVPAGMAEPTVRIP
jgi:nitroimidazol reductase NimA-like FMN-containing flavoprotein (pyridoxamine 5'-phosphate oxidase superfamily)